MSEQNLTLLDGIPSPLGSFETADGINFSFVASQAELAEILIFSPSSSEPFFTASLSKDKNKTEKTWHACIKNLKGPFEYSYRTFQNDKWSPDLIDPYAKALSSSSIWNEQKNYHPKSRFFSIPPFDWQGIEKIKTNPKDWIIYEMHVRGFTRHISSQAKNPGTFLGVIEKIPYLKSLGVNAVELLPVFEFNECENLLKNPNTEETLLNFWGYSPIHFFCPMQRYASCDKWEAPILEFKEMVRELHRNGIAVILDVVYNHTGEKGSKDEGILSFKGLDNEAYYLLDPHGNYYNFAGTGNTLNCNHPTTLKLILDSLIFWAQEMQVDGFRFDLASILTRGLDGEPLDSPPILKAMAEEPLLKETLLIAEAWDAAGLYQVGSFANGTNWAEWNGKFRDVSRCFIKGSPSCAGEFAQALCGSQDLYSKASPSQSINFITAHDGYSLRDLVSYQEKHNLTNGESNKDGNNNNMSWNCGQEGFTTNQKIIALRNRQMTNFITALMISLGTPLILMGDEYAHTRLGNNNPYCQDNELNWFLWDSLEKNEAFFLFFKKALAFRKNHSTLFSRDTFLTDQDILWHGLKPFQPNWNSERNLIAYSLKDPLNNQKFFFALNAQKESVLIELPHRKKQIWSRIVDTSLSPPYDFIEKEEDQPRYEKSYLLPSYSLFIAKSNLPFDPS